MLWRELLAWPKRSLFADDLHGSDTGGAAAVGGAKNQTVLQPAPAHAC